MQKVMEVIYHHNKQMKYGIFLENRWKDIVNSFFVEGNMDIPEDLQEKNIDSLTEEDYMGFFKALDYTVVGISEYDPNIHIPSVITKTLINEDEEEELPQC